MAKGPAHYAWKGGRKMSPRGYVLIHTLGHPRASKGYVLEHLLVAERAVGRLLPLPVVVHHIDGDTTCNDGHNLVVCPDQPYHNELHRKQRVLRAGGNPWTQRMCCDCGMLKETTAFYFSRGRYTSDCKECHCLAASRILRRRASGENQAT